MYICVCIYKYTVLYATTLPLIDVDVEAKKTYHQHGRASGKNQQELANKDAVLQKVAKKCPPTWTLQIFIFLVSSPGMPPRLYTQT